MASHRPNKQTRVRASSGPLRALSDDPVDRYKCLFIQLIEHNLQILDQPMHALDLVCGKGLPSLTLARRLPPQSRIISIGDDRRDLRHFHERLPRDLGCTIFPRKERRDRLPFASHIFDAVWAALPSEQLSPLRAILRQALRVLKPGGQLLLSVPLRATFSELAHAVCTSLEGHQDFDAFSSLLSEPPQLLASDDWQRELNRCGAIEVEITTDQAELIIATPLSAEPLFAECLVPLWLGNTQHGEVLELLDHAITEPLALTVHVGCIVARRGTAPLDDSATPV